MRFMLLSSADSPLSPTCRPAFFGLIPRFVSISVLLLLRANSVHPEDDKRFISLILLSAFVFWSALLYCCEHLRSLQLWQRFPLSLLVELDVLHDTGSEELKAPEGRAAVITQQQGTQRISTAIHFSWTSLSIKVLSHLHLQPQAYWAYYYDHQCYWSYNGDEAAAGGRLLQPKMFLHIRA